MNKGLLLAALLVAGVGSLAADPLVPQPQWLFNADGAAGMDTAPAALSGDMLYGGQAGFEYLPAQIPGQVLGWDVDYDYLAVGKSPRTGTDNDLDLSLRYIPMTWGMTSVWLQGGIGYNFSTNDVSGHYLAFLEPGVRVVVAPRVAIDAGVQYLVTTPATNMVQSLGVTLGVSIPLDAPFSQPKGL